MQNTAMNNVMILAQAVEPAQGVVPAAQQTQTEIPANECEAQQPQALFGGGMSSILIWVLLFAGLWFLMFMPQRKRQKALAKLQSELKVGDTVYTSSGIVGKIVSIEDTTVTLQVSENTRIPFLRNAVLGIAAAK